MAYNRKNPNHMHWIIKVFDRLGKHSLSPEGEPVQRSYFDGTAAQCRKHIEREYRTRRPNASSGAKKYWEPTRYKITAQPNGMCFDVEERS